jgi:hypothetical protein
MARSCGISIISTSRACSYKNKQAKIVHFPINNNNNNDDAQCLHMKNHMCTQRTELVPDDPVAVPVVHFSEALSRHNDRMLERQQGMLVGFLLHTVCDLTGKK